MTHLLNALTSAYVLLLQMNLNEAINNLTKNNDTALVSIPQESIVPCVDNLFTKYMEEYQPDSAFGLPLNGDLAKTVNLFCDTKLSADKLKERQLREMRHENIDLFMRTINSTIFKLHCGDVSNAHHTDMKLQHVEQNGVKATYPLVRAVEDLQKLQHPAIAPAIAKIMDGIIPLTDTVQDCEQTRRDLYKNVIPGSWKGLLEKPEEQHQELFGHIETRFKSLPNRKQNKGTGGGGKG